MEKRNRKVVLKAIMYNLHSHSLLSDGVLLPSEVAVRYLALGYKVIAITDHTDYSNVDTVINSILKFASNWPAKSGITVLPGVELTHLPLEQFKPLTNYCRKNGIKVVAAHGQTLVEPVLEGTNRAAIEAGVDILAHPGLITEDEVKLAKENNVFLEITSRKGHSDTNPHVVEMAKKYGAKLVLNTDSHMPDNIISYEDLKSVAIRAGLSDADIEKIAKDTDNFLQPIAK